MNDDRVPLFCDSALAKRLERVEAELIAEASKSAHRRRADTAGFVIQIAGGVTSFAEQGSPFNKLAGLGFGGVPTVEALDEIERAYTALRRSRADRARAPRRPRGWRAPDETGPSARVV